MAGRPRMMAKRVGQLYETYSAVAEELQKLMPKQYQKPTTDLLGQTWQHAVATLTGIDDYFFDLVSLLEFKAERAEQRAAAATKVTEVDTDMAESAAPLSRGPGP